MNADWWRHCQYKPPHFCPVSIITRYINFIGSVGVKTLQLPFKLAYIIRNSKVTILSIFVLENRSGQYSFSQKLEEKILKYRWCRQISHQYRYRKKGGRYHRYRYNSKVYHIPIKIFTPFFHRIWSDYATSIGTPASTIYSHKKRGMKSVRVNEFVQN